MPKITLMPHDWEVLDKYIEDMLVAIKNGEIGVSLVKSYLSQYIYEASYTDIDEIIEIMKTRAAAAREHGWAKSH